MFRLKSLYIKEYKNIKGQQFDFSNNTGYIALIGLNGSGKSNLLEAISLIFDELYGIPHIEQAQVNGYIITFEIAGIEYTYRTVDDTEAHNIIPLRVENGAMLPSSVIACYSGEDLRLWNMAYMPYYMGFFQKALHGKDYIPQTIYINKYCWKIALISLMFSHTQEIADFVRDTLHIDIARVTIKLEYNEIANPQPHDAYNWLEGIKQKYGVNDIPLVYLRDFGLGNTQYTTMTEDVLIFYYLYFLYMPSGNSRQSVNKVIENINISLGDYNFDALSEGVKKLILIECITRILGDENSLVLLDEPDAHVHIENKKKILEEAIIPFEGQTILTTHSPIFTNLMMNTNIFPLEEGKAISAEQRDLIVKMANNNINYIDGACIIASKYLVVTEGPGDINYITAAIQACGRDDAQFKVLEKVSLVYAGGAKMVGEFYDEILSSLYDTLTKIVFVFDLDSEGRDGAKIVQKLIDSGKNKIKIVYYNNNYPIVDPNNTDFYLEDMFSRDVYNIVQLPHIGGEPTYAQLKKGNTLAGSIKSKIAELYKKKLLNDEDYYPFKPFLRQLKYELGL